MCKGGCLPEADWGIVTLGSGGFTGHLPSRGGFLYAPIVALFCHAPIGRMAGSLSLRLGLRSKFPYASIVALLMRGMVMHRGPPRPRDSSLLGMVST